MTDRTAHPTSEILSLYHDREGAREILTDVEAHLARCPDCQRELDRLRKLSHVLSSVVDEEAPAEVLEQISARLRSGDLAELGVADLGTNDPVPPAPARPVRRISVAHKWMGLAALVLIAALTSFVISNRAGTQLSRLEVAEVPAGVPAGDAARDSAGAAPVKSEAAKERGSGAKSKEDGALLGLELKAEPAATPFRILGVRPVAEGDAEDDAERASYCWQLAAGDGEEEATLRALEAKIRAWKAGDFDAPASDDGGAPAADQAAQLARLLDSASAASAAGEPNAAAKTERHLALDLSVPREELPALLAFLGAWEAEKAKPAAKLGAARGAAREEARHAAPTLESLPPSIELRIVIKAAESAGMHAPEKSTEQRK